MKYFLLSLLMAAVLGSCKTEVKKEEPAEEAPDILEEVALAHGFEHWKNVDILAFTFNVDRDTIHFERSWTWDVRKQEVTMTSANDTVTYLRQAVDSTLMQVDAGFVNDKYWLLAPFNLMWDRGAFTFEVTEDSQAPISGLSMKKLTITYSNEGGYTPGDAYDFFLDEESKIKEWIFRKGNQPEPSLATSWEDYQVMEGLVISHMHKKADDSFKLYFTGIEIN